MKCKKIIAPILLTSLIVSLACISVSAQNKESKLISVKDAFHTSKADPFEQTSLGELYNTIANKPIVADTKISSAKTSTSFKSSVAANSSVPKNYPKRKGTILVTGDGYEGVLPTGHAAIVYSSTQVVESLNSGVAVGKNDWYKSKHTCVAGSLYATTKAQDAAAANWCKKQLGKPYNFEFYNMATRSKFYCSQLVWASFKDKFDIDLNMDDFDAFLDGQKIAQAIHPYELLANSKTYIVYRHNWAANKTTTN